MINDIIKDSSIEDKLNMNDIDKEAEDLEKVFEWFKYTNHCVLYISYIGNGLIKLGYSDCGLLQRQLKHMSSTETEFDQFRIIGAYKISSRKIENVIKDLLIRYRVNFNKQIEIYQPQGTLKQFCEMVHTLLIDNDLRYQLDVALKRAEVAEARVKELEERFCKV
jgi:hypothetical protein